MDKKKRHISNPFVGLEGYSCFGCSPYNLHGLQMEFDEEGDEVISRWQPDKRFEGYKNVLHGGIQVTMLDEIASWTVYIKVHTAGVASKINAKFRLPVNIDRGAVTLRASLIRMEKNIAHLHTELYDGENNLCTEAEVFYYTYPEEEAQEKLHFPGVDAFFLDNIDRHKTNQ